MNSGRAKKIAKALYGNLSRKGALCEVDSRTGQIFREDLRRKYQVAKAQHTKVVTVVGRKKTRIPKWYNKT